MKPAPLRLVLLFFVGLLVAVAAVALQLESAVPYMGAAMGLLAGLLLKDALRIGDSIVLCINYTLVFVCTGFLGGRSFVFFLQGHVAAGAIFALFACCAVLGLAIGRRIRPSLEKRS